MQPSTSPSQSIYGKMVQIMKDVDAIEKEQKNSFHNYNFRGIDSVFNALHPVFARHGVFMLPHVIEQKREERTTKKQELSIHTVVLVRFVFMCEDGSSVECIAPGEGSDNGDKSINKAMSSAIKNALLQVFMIPTKEEKDSEVASPEFTPTTTRVTTIAQPAQPAAPAKPMPIDADGQPYDIQQALLDAFTVVKINAAYVKLGACQGHAFEDWIETLHSRAIAIGAQYDQTTQSYIKPDTINPSDPNTFVNDKGEQINMGVLLTQVKTAVDFNKTLDFLDAQAKLGKNVAIWKAGFIDKAVKAHGLILDEKSQRLLQPVAAAA